MLTLETFSILNCSTYCAEWFLIGATDCSGMKTNLNTSYLNLFIQHIHIGYNYHIHYVLQITTRPLDQIDITCHNLCYQIISNSCVKRPL